MEYRTQYFTYLWRYSCLSLRIHHGGSYTKPSNCCDKIKMPKITTGCRIKSFPSKHSSWWRRLWRRLEDVFHLRLQMTSWRLLQTILIKMNMFALALRLQKTSWSRPIYSSWPYVFKMSSRRFQDVFKTSLTRLAKISSICFQDVSLS